MQIGKRLQILAVEERKSQKGNAYQVAQCVVQGEQIKVGELWHFNTKALALQAGEFFAQFEVAVDMDRKITAELTALLPASKAAPGQSAGPSTVRKHIQILAVEERKSQKGNAYQVAQCVVHGEQIKVGELWHFNTKSLTLSPGDFVAEFEVSVDMDRKITAELVGLSSVAKAGASQPKAAAAVPA